MNSLPSGAIVYFSSSGFSDLHKKISSQSLILEKLKMYTEVSYLFSTLDSFDSLLRVSDLLNSQLQDNPVHLGLYGTKDLHWLAVFNLKELGAQDKFLRDARSVLKSRTFSDNIHTFTLGGKKRYISLENGTVWVSSAPELIKEAADPSGTKLCNDRLFGQFTSTLEKNNLLSVFIDHDRYSRAAQGGLMCLSGMFSGGSSAAVVGIEPSEIRINGFTEPTDTLATLLVNEQPQSVSGFLNNLPADITYLKIFGFSSYESISKKINDHSGSEFWQQSSDRALYDVKGDFIRNSSNGIAEFKTATLRSSFIFLPVADSLKALEHLALMSDSATTAGDSIIFTLGPGPVNLFAPFSNVKCSFAAYKNGGLYFGNDRGTLSLLLKDISSRSLETNEKFNRYALQNFPDKVNLLVYVVPSVETETVKEFLGFKEVDPGNEFTGFNHASFTMVNDAEHFRFRFQLEKSSESTGSEPAVLWTVRLNAPSAMPPQEFVNHNTGEREIVVQDEQNNLYLLNAKGQIIWKKQLNEKIEGGIHMVDAFRNNKYQMVFNTGNYLHLIDRKGNYPDGYPVKLPAASTAPLSVFDYENDRNYRLFIPCRDKAIYNYTISGAQQQGFEPVRTDNHVKLPVQYIKIGMNDYLVAVDDEGKIYTFSRKGAPRISLRNRCVAGCTAFFTDGGANLNTSYLVYVDDKNGIINKISFTDKKEIVRLPSGCGNCDVKFSLIDDNRHMDVVITGPQGISGYDLSGSLLFHRDSEHELNKGDVYNDETHSVVLAFSNEAGQLEQFALLRQKAATYKATAMPLVCDLFNDTRKYLITVDGDRVSCRSLDQ